MTSATFFFVFIPILAIILLAVNLIFAPHNPYQEKDSVFECGFHSFLGQNRTQFSISFFIFALLFLLFDLEILLVYPYVVSAHTNGIYGLVIMLVFFLALTLGFAFELGKNALKIDSRQMVNLNNKPTAKTMFISGFENFHKLFKIIYSKSEWALNSPPKPHAFVSLSLQSFFPSAIWLSRNNQQIESEIDQCIVEQITVREEVRQAEGDVDDAKERFGDTSEEYFQKTDRLEALNKKDNDLDDQLDALEAELNANHDASESTED